MAVRTTSKTVTFRHPFNLTGTDEVQPAGTYTVETDEELLQPSSVPAYSKRSVSGPAQAAARVASNGCQFQGRSSAIRRAGWSAMRTSRSAR